MSALVVDTSSWISYLAGSGSRLLEEALAESRVYLPLVVAAELLSGPMSQKNRLALESLLADLPVCGIELEHWFRVGRLRETLGRKGVAISTPDAHVAQCAIDISAELLTEDRVFQRIARHAPLRLASRAT